MSPRQDYDELIRKQGLVSFVKINQKRYSITLWISSVTFFKKTPPISKTCQQQIKRSASLKFFLSQETYICNIDFRYFAIYDVARKPMNPSCSTVTIWKKRMLISRRSNYSNSHPRCLSFFINFKKKTYTICS